MMRTLLKTTMLLLLLVSSGVYGQRGIGTNTPDKSAILELASTTKGFLLPRLTRVYRNAIVSPVAGLAVYCTDCSSGKISFYNNDSYWSDVPNAPVIVTATAGAAQATVSYTAPAESRGSDITSYTATASPGGFTGTLRHPGNGTIIVTGLANGTEYTFTVTATNVTGAGPASAASNSVTPVAVPGAPGIGTATESSGQAAVAYTAPADDGGSVITRYTATSSPGGVTGFLEQPFGSTIIFTGLTNGTGYTFTVTATNGIGAGAASAASNSVTPDEIVTSTTGRIWMDRNLGATQVATSSQDFASYGELYQWGRAADGHQVIVRDAATPALFSPPPDGSSGTVAGPVASGSEGATFITTATNTSAYDWLSTKDDVRWNTGIEMDPVKNITNDPCPTGYRIPTKAELDTERLSWTTNNATGAMNSPLKLPLAGYRYRGSTGAFLYVGSRGHYWSSTVSSTDARNLDFNSGTASMNNSVRARGNSVRCIKD
jgi:uncharacterized protein (TIGR02145 family)